jgi:hypothetical protein
VDVSTYMHMYIFINKGVGLNRMGLIFEIN